MNVNDEKKYHTRQARTGDYVEAEVGLVVLGDRVRLSFFFFFFEVLHAENKFMNIYFYYLI